ncbi:MAG: DUF3857 domain-containing protein [Opitutaceae bacterium]
MNSCFRPILRAALLISVATPAVWAHGAEANPYSGPLWALRDEPRVMKAADAVTPARYPNCDAATVDENILEVYRADGTADTQDETFTKVLTEKGKQDNAVLKEEIMLPYFHVDVARLEIIKPDGRVVPVDLAANSKESIDQSQMAENIYDPNMRILQVNIPGLEIGDVVHSVVRTTVLRPIIPNAFGDMFVFEGPQYILHTSYEVRSPASAPLAHAMIRDPVAGTITASRRVARDGSIVRHWEINRVPRMYDEPGMPPYENVLQRILVSTLPDWRAVSRWYWNLSAPHLAATTPDMAKVVARLVAGAPNDEARIKAIFYYVSQNIRYMGVTPEKNRPGFEPHDVKLTFEKKYGVCRDKAALLVAMLRMAGEKAYPVLINVGSRLDPDVPLPFFNHAIVAVESSPGHDLLMDPTDEHTRVLLPAYDDHQSYLVCTPEGQELKTSPIVPADRNTMHIRTTGTLADDGTLTARSVLSFGGINDDAYRGAFAEMKSDVRRRFFETRLQQVMPGARLTDLRIEPRNVFDEAVPLRAEIGFVAPGMAAFGARQAIVTVPWLGRHFGVVNYFLKATGLARRKYPMIIDATGGIDERISLKFSGLFSGAVAVPAASKVEADCVGYRREFGFSHGLFEASDLLRLKKVEYSPAEYLQLKRTLKEVDYDGRKAPVLALSGTPAPAAAPVPPPGAERIGSDAEVLQDRQWLIVTDAHTATLRVHYVKRILSYAGKIAESEVKIPYNPATESVKLLHAVVTTASGQRQVGSRDEVNIMDAGWNASAKRYTGGKILVDSLPGVEIGATIDVEYEIVEHDMPYVGGFQSFQLAEDLDGKSFEATVPAGVAFQSRITGPAGLVTVHRSTAGGRELFDWQGRSSALPQEEDPPPAWAYQGGVEYFVGNAAHSLERIDRAMRARAREDGKAAALARRLATGARSGADIVTAIRDYVARQVREAGPAFTELPLRELSAADTTLADGYGDSADRAILLYAMLKAAGLHPRFVLASDLPSIPPLAAFVRSNPLPEAFDAPLVRVTMAGRTEYLNDTDQYAELGSTAHADGLAVVPATGAYVTVRATKEGRSGVDTSYGLSIEGNGDAKIAIERRFYGIAYAAENRRFSELRPEENALYFQQLVSGVAQGARPVGPLFTDFNGYPGIERYMVEIDHYAIVDGRFLYFTLPFTPQLLPTTTGQRMLPLLVTSDWVNTIEADVALPAGFQRVLIAPEPAKFEAPDGAGSARISTACSGGHWTVTYRLDPRPALLPTADYPKALKVESALENRAARELLLEAPSPARSSADRPAGPAKPI